MICLFGGTFDPVHRGHLHAATTVCDALGVDEIRLILSARPSHRKTPGATIEQRWEMLCLACATDSRLHPDDREIRRARPSFTVDTLTELRAEHPRQSLVWVIGSDAFALLPSWYRWQQVLELAHLLVLKRPGYALELDDTLRTLTAAAAVNDAAALESHSHGSILVLERQMQEVSAEGIRSTIAAGGSAEDLLPATVATYIRSHALYGG